MSLVDDPRSVQWLEGVEKTTRIAAHLPSAHGQLGGILDSFRFVLIYIAVWINQQQEQALLGTGS